MDDDTEKAVRALTRLPLFPFEGEFALKTIGPPMAAELVRDGEGGKPCHSCGKDDRVLWRNDRWKVTFFQPSINPVGLFLDSRRFYPQGLCRRRRTLRRNGLQVARFFSLPEP